MPVEAKGKVYAAALVDKQTAVREFAPLVKKIALRFRMRLPPDIDLEDMIQVGLIGLLEAYDRYDDSRDANFKTFAEYRIRGAMLDELRSRDWIPRSVRTNANRLEKAFLALRKKGVENPTNQNLADELELSLPEFEDFLTKNNSIPLVSLECFGNADGNLNILEVLSDPNAIEFDDQMLADELIEKLTKAIQSLPKRDQLILSLSFKDELNLKEIAKTLDITEARVCQIRTKIIGQLRSYLAE